MRAARALLPLAIAAAAGTVLTARAWSGTRAPGPPSAETVAAEPAAPTLHAAVSSWTTAGTDRDDVAPDAAQRFQYYEYDGRVTFVRIRPKDDRAGGGWGFRRSREPPWAHDYPSAERNLSKIVHELTFARVRVEDYGGNILELDDPRLMQFPVAYMSEPGYWSVTPDEADALREYLLKGGFIIFDDFGGNRQGEMYNLVAQMERVMPELSWVRLDASAEIFDSFFEIDPDNLALASSGDSYRGVPVFYGLYENNDPEKRLVAIAADGGDFGEFWEFSDRGYYPVDISNEAYKVGINYLVYALTH